MSFNTKYVTAVATYKTATPPLINPCANTLARRLRVITSPPAMSAPPSKYKSTLLNTSPILVKVYCPAAIAPIISRKIPILLNTFKPTKVSQLCARGFFRVLPKSRPLAGGFGILRFSRLYTLSLPALRGRASPRFFRRATVRTLRFAGLAPRPVRFGLLHFKEQLVNAFAAILFKA